MSMALQSVWDPSFLKLLFTFIIFDIGVIFSTIYFGFWLMIGGWIACDPMKGKILPLGFSMVESANSLFRIKRSYRCGF